MNTFTSYPYELPSLPYDYGALEPYIDTLTMEIHHTRHHQGYVTKLNEALEGHPDWAQYSLSELLSQGERLPTDLQKVVRNQGGGHFNHSFFWKIMAAKGGKPHGKIKERIEKQFGSFDAFKDQFEQAAKSRFGSGWAWLVLDSTDTLKITSTANQDCPIVDNLMPILGLDVWEHAYYLQYQWRRPDYISAWWSVVNWEQVEENYRLVHSS